MSRELMKGISIFIVISYLVTLHVSCVAKNSFNHVASKYEQVNGDISTLFYPAKNPKRMLVIFSWDPRNYSMWSWFWNDQEQWSDTCYLFISDLRTSRGWYLDKDASTDFENRLQSTITYFMNQAGLSSDKLFFSGASMGGYGALYHGIKMKVHGVIVFNPQVGRSGAGHWNSDILNSGTWFKELDYLVEPLNTIPCIALYVSSYIKDFSAAQQLVNAIMKKNCFFMYTKVNGNYHSGADMFGFNKQLVERDIMALEAR